MFNLTLIDHLRLTFAHVVFSHRVHADQAARLTRRAKHVRLGHMSLQIVTLLGATLALLGYGRWTLIVTAMAAACSLSVHAIAVALDVDGLAQAHRTAGARLWLVREQYRALLTDLAGGVLDPEAARIRRDRLMQEAHAIYEAAPPTEVAMYQSARKALLAADAVAPRDDEVDQLLPPSLRRGAGAPMPDPTVAPVDRAS